MVGDPRREDAGPLPRPLDKLIYPLRLLPCRGRRYATYQNYKNVSDLRKCALRVTAAAVCGGPKDRPFTWRSRGSRPGRVCRTA